MKISDFKDDVVYVTGAAGQIGRHLSKDLLNLGAKVIMIDNSKKRLESFLSDSNLDERNYLACEVDISNLLEVKESIKKGFKKFGKINMQVNNAGASIFSPWYERSQEELDLTIDVNLKGTFYCISELLKAAYQENIETSIVNVASHYGLIAPDPRIYRDLNRRNSEIYGATKAGIIQLTKYFATNALMDGYSSRINAIAPGGVFNSSNPQGFEFIQEYASRVPMKRMANTKEIVNPIIFLLSSSASYINGTTLVVDGGMSCW